MDLKFVEEYDNFSKLQILGGKPKCKLDRVNLIRSQDPFIIRLEIYDRGFFHSNLKVCVLLSTTMHQLMEQP